MFRRAGDCALRPIRWTAQISRRELRAFSRTSILKLDAGCPDTRGEPRAKAVEASASTVPAWNCHIVRQKLPTFGAFVPNGRKCKERAGWKRKCHEMKRCQSPWRSRMLPRGRESAAAIGQRATWRIASRREDLNASPTRRHRSLAPWPTREAGPQRQGHRLPPRPTRVQQTVSEAIAEQVAHLSQMPRRVRASELLRAQFPRGLRHRSRPPNRRGLPMAAWNRCMPRSVGHQALAEPAVGALGGTG